MDNLSPHGRKVFLSQSHEIDGDHRMTPVLALCARAYGHPTHYQDLMQQIGRVEHWDKLPEIAEHHGLGPLLYMHLRSVQAPIPTSARRALQSLYVRHRHANSIRMQALAEILNAFQDVGVEVLVLKGAALAHVVYPDPGLRPMRDIDLLVKFSDAHKAQTILADLGFDAPLMLSPDLPKNHYHLSTATRQMEGMRVSVEIHHHLFHRYGRIRPLAFTDLIETALPFAINGVTAYTLAHAEMLWHLYRHAFGVPQMFEEWRLIRVADMVSLVEKYLGQIDWQKVKRCYPQVLHVLPLFHFLTPWSENVLQQLALPIDVRPTGIGKEFQSWPRIKVSVQRQQGKRLWQIFREALFPPEWWQRLYYGIGTTPSWLWHRYIRHPVHMMEWLLKYCQKRFEKSNMAKNLKRVM